MMDLRTSGPTDILHRPQDMILKKFIPNMKTAFVLGGSQWGSNF